VHGIQPINLSTAAFRCGRSLESLSPARATLTTRSGEGTVLLLIHATKKDTHHEIQVPNTLRKPQYPKGLMRDIARKERGGCDHLFETRKTSPKGPFTSILSYLWQNAISGNGGNIAGVARAQQAVSGLVNVRLYAQDFPPSSSSQSSHSPVACRLSNVV
jgi:hypothetical protein